MLIANMLKKHSIK